MVFPVVGGDGKPTGYEISNSLRYNYGDSPKLIKSGTSAGSTTFTFSAWLKFSVTNFYNFIFCSGDQIGLAKDRTQSGGQFYLNGATGGTYTNSDGFQRDPSAWYHAVVSCNSGTGIIYVNNVNRKGSINIPQLGNDLAIGHFMRTAGVETPQYDYYMDGYMSEVHFVDGTALNPSSFAEYNDNGVWIPKDCKDDLTYGTNGFYLQFKETGTSANSSGIGADTSGNDNHFTPTNLAATDVTVDTPTNNFMTMNPLFTNSRGTFAEGNLKVTTNVQGSVPYGQVEFGNFAVNKGKWYYEAKVTSVGSGGSLGLGWNERAESGGYTNGHNNGGSAGNVRYNSGGVLGIGSSHSQSTGVDSFTDGDIIGFALDLDNNKVYAYKNGNPQDDPTPDPDDNDGRAIVSAYNNYWTPWMSKDDTSNNATVEFNFGNPTFSISSGNADGNGYGNFEYAVPTNYYSLCTKNLAEYG